jgi:hypothetical protein
LLIKKGRLFQELCVQTEADDRESKEACAGSPVGGSGSIFSADAGVGVFLSFPAQYCAFDVAFSLAVAPPPSGAIVVVSTLRYCGVEKEQPLELVQYLLKSSLTTTVTVTVTAKMPVEYAHEHGCQLEKNVCCIAASNDRLKCLQYAHEHGCPWDANACCVAFSNGHFDCFEYAYEQGRL